MVKITKVKNFKLELPTNKNATTTKPKDSSKDKDYSIKTVNQDQNTEELNLNSSNSDKAKKKKLTKKEITKSLKQYGFNDKDIKRFLEGKITIKKLLKEIEKDPARKAELYKANYIQVLGLNFDNMDDLNSYIENQKKLIDKYNKQLENLNNDNSGQDFYNIAKLLIKGKSLDEALEKTAYWVDPQGNKYYTNPYYQRENENKKFIEVPYKDVYSEEQLKDIRSVLKNGKWNNSEESSELYIKLAENKNSFLSKKLEKTKELKEKLSKTTNEYNYYSEIANYINQEVDHQTKMIDPYTSKEDFLKKNNFNKDSLKKLKEIGERYNNTQVRHNNSMQEMVVSDKDEIVDVISCMLNGEGNIDNGFTTINGIQYTLESKDGLIDHYKKWKKVITDDEKKCFNYIYNTKGKEEAYKYLQDISNELDNRWLLRQQYEDKEFAKKNSFLASVGSVLHTPIEGLSSIYYSLNSKITGEKIRRSDVYSAGDIMRAAIAEDINNYWKKRGNATLGKNLSFWYSTGMSMADTAELIALTVATGGAASPLLSATVMGSRAYVSTLNNALDKGLSDEQAILLATSSAVAETAMENYSVGHLLNLEGKLGESVTKNAGKIASKIGNKKIADIVTKGYYIAASAVSQGLAEGEEELATEIVNYLADIFIAKDMSDFCKSIENYTRKGLSDEQALLNTVKDFGSQLNQAFTGGFASGICFGGFSGASSTIKTSNSIAQNLYNDLKGDTKAQKFANALEINQQEIETYNKALEKLKKGELLTQEEHKLLINGTTESQAGLFDNNRKKNIEKLAKETNSSSKVAQIIYDNNYPVEIAQIMHDNKCSVEIALYMYNYNCNLEEAVIRNKLANGEDVIIDSSDSLISSLKDINDKDKSHVYIQLDNNIYIPYDEYQNNLKIDQKWSKAKTFSTSDEAAIYFEDANQYLYKILSDCAESNEQAQNYKENIENFILGEEFNKKKGIVSCIDTNDLYNFLTTNNYLTTEQQKIASQLIEKSSQTNVTQDQQNQLILFTAHLGLNLAIYNRESGIFKESHENLMIDTALDYQRLNPERGIREYTAEEYNETLDSLIKGYTVKEDIIVVRAVDMGPNNNFLALQKPGDIFTDPAHLSTSVLNNINYFNEKNTILEILVPKGTNAFYIEKYGHTTGQQELILGRNTCLKMVKYPSQKIINGELKTVIQLEVVPSTQENLSKAVNANLNLHSYEQLFNPIKDGVDFETFNKKFEQYNLKNKYSETIKDMTSKKLYDGVSMALHDYQHVENVIKYSMYMGKELNLSDIEMEILTDCAEYHDSGLKYAGHNGHAKVSAKILEQQLLNKKYDENTIKLMKAIVEYHEIDDKDFNLITTKYQLTKEEEKIVTKLGTILKDADAIDRTRFPGNLDVGYLRNDIAKQLVKSAYQNREKQAEITLINDIKAGRYNEREKYEIKRLYESNISPMIINFAAKYKNVYGTSFYSITEYALYIEEKKSF